jgi:hypothetical protein
MPHEEPVMSRRQTVRDASTPDAFEQEQPTDAYEPIDEQDEWLEEAELPRRPRRRIISPIPLALLGVLLVACGFIGGVLVEKGQNSSSSAAGSAASLASRFAALRSGASGAAGGAGASLLGGAGGAGGAGAGSGSGGAGGATAGSVAYISGNTLYVTTAEGNTVKVTTSAGTAVTKTVKADVPGIHPGETVLVTGTPGANGAVSAESIRVGGGAGGGFGALFGGAGTGAGRGAGAGKSGAEPSLFGPG